MPDNDMSIIIPLEQTGSSQILLYLYMNRDRDGLNITELTQHVKASRETILRTINFLVKYKIIDERIEKKFPCEHIVNLTDRGLVWAKSLFEAWATLQDQDRK